MSKAKPKTRVVTATIKSFTAVGHGNSPAYASTMAEVTTDHPVDGLLILGAPADQSGSEAYGKLLGKIGAAYCDAQPRDFHVSGPVAAGDYPHIVRIKRVH